jgi:hypothetical protein
MRHHFLYCLLYIILLNLSACNSGNSNSTTRARTHSPALKLELRRVTGSFVNFDITTFIAIRCSAYERQFGHENPFLVNNSTKLQAITHRLAALRADTMGLEMDTRAKAVLFYNNQTQDTLCMGKFICFYRGQSFRADTMLYQLLGVTSKE